MNILLVSQFLSTTKGGGEHLFSLMANGFAERGHKVWVITHKIENENYELFHKNVTLVFVSSIKYEGGLPPSFIENIRFVFEAIIKGLQIIYKEKINIIHSNNFSPALSSSFLSYLTCIPHITSVWDIFSLCGENYWNRWASQKGVSKIHAFLGPRFEKIILRLRHSAIHTISNASRDDLVQFGVKKPMHVIKPCIIILQNEKQVVDPFQFVYVGRLVFYKNVETVIRSIPIVKSQFPNIKLRIIGGGPHKEYLQELTRKLNIDENIDFLGYVTDEEKFKMISASNALVFPSLCEGFGLVILESFSCHRPVLVSDVRPLSDIVYDRIDGLVVNSNDERKWAESIIYLIQNPNDSSKMGAEGNKKLFVEYKLDDMIREIKAMYDKYVH